MTAEAVQIRIHGSAELPTLILSSWLARELDADRRGCAAHWGTIAVRRNLLPEHLALVHARTMLWPLKRP